MMREEEQVMEEAASRKRKAMSGNNEEAEAKKVYGKLLVGVEEKGAVVDKIAEYARDARIVDSIQRIQHPGATMEVVLGELRDNHPDVGRVCSAALEKLLAFIMEKPKGRDYGDPGERPAVARSLLAAGALEPVLDSMSVHAEMKSVQVTGATLLCWFLNHCDRRVPAKALSSQHGIQTLFGAVQRFHNDAKVQTAIWSIMSPLEQASISIRADNGFRHVGLETLSGNLLEANALALAYSALEHHTDNNEIIIGALTVFSVLSIHARRAFLEFARDKQPDFGNLIDRIIDNHHRGGDTFYIHREASMVQMALGGF